jgi:hypothetical protein
MVNFRRNKGCKNGGSPPFCKIRKYCEKKGIEGCWECDMFEEGSKLNFLRSVHEDAHIRNIETIKIRK